MPTLVRNVWIEGRYYGPDHGGDDELPADLHDQVPDHAWSSVPVTPPAPTDLGKPYPLLAQAEALGIKVDRRWGDKRLAAEIAAAQGADTDASQ